jgi:hypothetical protein
VPEAAAILARLDAIMAELAELAALMPPAAVNGVGEVDDFAPEHLIEISTAVSIRKLLADKLGRARPIMT